MGIIECIETSFRALLLEVTYDQITVAQICERAAVSKKTFYKHFEGKHELLVAVLRNDLVMPVTNLREILPLDEIKSAPLLVMERMHQILYDNRQMYKSLINNPGKAQMVELFTNATYNLNLEIYGNYGLDPLECDYAAYFCAAASAMIQIRWLEQGCALDPKHMAKLNDTWVMSH
ncbi:MAG: TetR/AcrR family transcriptional regulator [Coriobacteriales bacterium]|jgi:AcrR family transcriptional regulator|nr:TetR/AcrR family transcriptional regulator [Coriobacteriales bacterium]